MNELEEYLKVAGFGPRRAQSTLYEHLISTDKRGVIAQAGTGTGKSAAVISAAAHGARLTGRQSIIVTPTLTLMNQYRDGDLPIAYEAFPDLLFAELRGRAHYFCEQTAAGAMEIFAANEDAERYKIGCGGGDAGCSRKAWMGHTEDCEPECPGEPLHGLGYRCDYQDAKSTAMQAQVVVTNADMLIVNDRILADLGAEIFGLDGTLLVDEAHTLDQKLRDWASRSLHWSTVQRFKFAGGSGQKLSNWIQSQDKNLALKDTRNFPYADLHAIANADVPEARPKDGLTKQRETQEACQRLVEYMADPHDHAVMHVGQGALKCDWINVSKSSGELLTARDFALVSATVPRTMAATLGVPDARFIDTGHPFNYGKQAWIGFSPYGGDYRSAQASNNQELRVNEVLDLLKRSKGGALLLFSSFKDLHEVHDWLKYDLERMGLTVLKQDRDMEAADRQAMADQFKADGNAVMFGSESFATGFDVPGDALRLVIVWKLPYSAVDPVSNAIRNQSYARYEDMMKVRVVQAIGRLIRRESDKGVVWIADSRGRKLLDARDPLTSHIPEFARL